MDISTCLLKFMILIPRLDSELTQKNVRSFRQMIPVCRRRFFLS